MAHLGDKARSLCELVSKEIIQKRCNRPNRIKDIEALLVRIEHIQQQNRYTKIEGYHLMKEYKPRLESILDGLKRMQEQQSR